MSLVDSKPISYHKGGGKLHILKTPPPTMFHVLPVTKTALLAETDLLNPTHSISDVQLIKNQLRSQTIF